MDKNVKKRIAFALKCKLEEVPEDPAKLKDALDAQRVKLKKAKAVKHG